MKENNGNMQQMMKRMKKNEGEWRRMKENEEDNGQCEVDIV